MYHHSHARHLLSPKWTREHSLGAAGRLSAPRRTFYPRFGTPPMDTRSSTLLSRSQDLSKLFPRPTDMIVRSAGLDIGLDGRLAVGERQQICEMACGRGCSTKQRYEPGFVGDCARELSVISIVQDRGGKTLTNLASRKRRIRGAVTLKD